MNLLIKLLLNAVAVFVLAHVLHGVTVDSYLVAIIVAVVISVLNTVVKPLLVILTLPITILTLGLFLLIINASIILLADKLIDGFCVDGLWIALLFSLLLSVLRSILYFIFKDKKST
jgi:putative membrane protein